jgi:hypothetical protein
MRRAVKVFANLVVLGILAVAIFVEHDWGFIGAPVFGWVVINGIAAHVRRQRLTRPLPGERHLSRSGERARGLGDDRRARRKARVVHPTHRGGVAEGPLYY